MGHRSFPTLFFCLVLLPLAAAAGPASVTVQTVDDKTIAGKLLSLGKSSITVDVSKEKEPPKPTTVPFDDISQVVLREPPQKAKPTPPSSGDNPGGGRPKSILTKLFGIFSSEDSSQEVSAAPADKVDKPRPATTQRADHDIWQINLANGDSLHARMVEWTGPALKVKFNEPMAQEAEIPIDRIAQVWCADAGEIARATSQRKDTVAGQLTDDVAFVAKDQDIIPVTGHALGIEGEMLKFRFGDSDRKIARNRLVGIQFGAAHPPAGSAGFHQTISLDSGDTMSGEWTAVDKDAVVLRTAWAPALRLPLNSIYTIDFVNGRQVFLDMTPVKVEQTPYFGRVIPFRLDTSLDGGPLNLGDTTCAKGIAVHSRCVLSYDTGGAYEKFRARLGFEQPAGRQGRVAVRVVGGDRVLYENPDLRGDQPPVDLNVDISSVRQLTLEIDFGKGQDVGDRVIWGNARLVRSRIPDAPGK